MGRGGGSRGGGGGGGGGASNGLGSGLGGGHGPAKRTVDVEDLIRFLSRGGGGGGGGGSGGNGGGGQRRANGGGGGGRGGNGGPNGGPGGGGQRSGGGAGGGDGDWACAECGFLRNFARRVACLSCGAARGHQPLRPSANVHRGGLTAPRGGKGTATAGGGAAPGGRGQEGGKGGLARPRGVPGTAASAGGAVARGGPPAHGLRPQPRAAPLDGSSRSGGYVGPIGADGKRPLLSSSWAGIAARSATQVGGGELGKPAGGKGAKGGMRPATGVAGGSSASSSAAAAPRTATDGVVGGEGPRRSPVVDAEGFTLVVGKGKGKLGKASGADVPPPADDAGAAAPTSGTLHREAGAGAIGGQGSADAEQRDLREEAAQPEEEAFEDAVEEGPTVDDLRGQMDRDKEAVDYLLQHGYGEDHPLLDAARAQAAASKARWPEARPGVAVTQRMLWAEKALARAKKAQAKMEQAIDDLDRDYEVERAARIEQLHDLRARTREREAKLACVSREAAEEFKGAAADGADGHLREAVGTIEGPLRDAVTEALACAPEGSALQTRLSGALGSLDSLRGLVEQVARPRWADVYDLAEDDVDHGEGGGGGGGHGGYHRAWYQPYDQQGVSWYGASGGWEEETNWYDEDQGIGEDAMDTSDVWAPSWMEPAPHTDAAPARAWQRRKLNNEDAGGMQGRHVGTDDAGTIDHANAARLQAATNDAATAQLVEPAPPTPNLAQQALERRKQEVWDLAQDQGIQVTMEAIANMAAEDLEEWSTKNLL